MSYYIYHIMKKAQFIQILFTILCLSVQKPQYYHSPLNLYVADSNSTAIFKQKTAKKQPIGVLFTNKYCQECHLFDQELQEIISMSYNSQNITIYRSQLGLNPGLQQQFAIKRFPMLHFVVPTTGSYKIYQNSEIVTRNSTLVVIKKLKYYLNLEVDITTLDQLIVNQQELTYVDQQQVFQVYGLDSLYQQLPLIHFVSNSQFRKLLEQQKVEVFDINTCLVYHLHDNKCYEPNNMQQFGSLLSFVAFQKVHQFTQSIYKHYQQLQINRFVFVAVLDSVFLRQKSRKYKEMLNKILKRMEISQRIVIFWMQAQINKQKLQHLGFQKTSHSPLFAHFDLNNPKKQVFQKSQDHFTQKQIVSFIKSIIEMDEQKQLTQWNNELLLQSLKRLGLMKKMSFLNSQFSFNQKDHIFVLSIPPLDYQSLGNKEIFYQPILSFNYLVRRIQRFSILGHIDRSITFQKIQCQNSSDYGFYSFNDNKCTKVTSNPFAKVEQLPEKIFQDIRKIYQLPEYFWIKQHDLPDFYSEKSKSAGQPSFSYVQIGG